METATDSPLKGSWFLQPFLSTIVSGRNFLLASVSGWATEKGLSAIGGTAVTYPGALRSPVCGLLKNVGFPGWAAGYGLLTVKGQVDTLGK